MPIQRLDHYSIRTSKLDECRKFYVDVLSLEVGERPPFKFPGLWLYNEGRAVVHIIGFDANDPKSLREYLGDRPAEEMNGTGSLDHVAFTATGLAEMRERLSRHGIAFTERTVPNLMLHQVFVKDPNGVTIELNYAASEA
jgi:catechol 2,3-dioxygenase-like lactoylglutathione lyase family enzyme